CRLRPGLRVHAIRCGGEHHLEGGTLAGRALGPDPAAVQLDDAAADRQPQPRATLVPGVSRVELHEPAEDRLELIGRDATTFVADSEQHRAVLLYRGDPD